MASEPAVPFLDLGAMHEDVRDEFDHAWRSIIDSSAFVGGSAVTSFEQDFAAFCARSHGVGVANGTDALGLILVGLGVGDGDEVIVPTNTFVATAEAVCAVGATPVFVDVDPATLLITAEHVRNAVTDRTAAAMIVHLYGQVADMDAIGRVCSEAGVHLIEDAAQAHGATWDGRPAGSFGMAAAFSFYPGKNLGAVGDGGAVVTDDAALAAAIRSLGNHGRAEGDAPQHSVVGTNSRLDGLHAAVLSIKLERLDEWNECRRTVHQWYSELLPPDVEQVAVDPMAESVHHLEVVLVDERDRVRQHLEASGIGTGIHYPAPCHRLPAYRRYADDGAFPVADSTAPRLLSLPMYPHLTRDEVARVCAALDAATSSSSAA